MFTPVLSGKALIGPFFEVEMMHATLSALAKHAIQAAQALPPFFKIRNKTDCVVRANYIELSGSWIEKFWGRPLDRAAIEQLRELMRGLPEEAPAEGA